MPTVFRFLGHENTGLPKLFIIGAFSLAELGALAEGAKKKWKITFTYQDYRNVLEYFVCGNNSKFLLHYQVWSLHSQLPRND